MRKLSVFYTKLVMVYKFKQDKDRKEAENLAFVAIRNMLGVILFFLMIFLICILDVNFNSPISSSINNFPRLYSYGIFAGLIFLYLHIMKLKLRPRLIIIDDIENNRNLKKYNRSYIKFIIGMSLFGGLCFVLIRLIYLNFS